MLYFSSHGFGQLPLLEFLVWTQNIRSIEDYAEVDDKFGSALATGDFNKDGNSDLAIGVPLESVGVRTKAGAADVI